MTCFLGNSRVSCAQYNTIQCSTIEALLSRTVVDYLVESEARAVTGQAKWAIRCG